MDDLLTAVALVLLFLASLLIGRARRNGHFDDWLEHAIIRFSRQVPVGSHRIESEIGIRFGREDTTLLLTLPLRTGGGQKPTRYRGMTDETTRFTVNHKDASPDELLEAYDDSLGPLEIQVFEPGRIAEIGIAADRSRSEPADGPRD